MLFLFNGYFYPLQTYISPLKTTFFKHIFLLLRQPSSNRYFFSTVIFILFKQLFLLLQQLIPTLFKRLFLLLQFFWPTLLKELFLLLLWQPPSNSYFSSTDIFSNSYFSSIDIFSNSYSSSTDMFILRQPSSTVIPLQQIFFSNSRYFFKQLSLCNRYFFKQLSLCNRYFFKQLSLCNRYFFKQLSLCNSNRYFFKQLSHIFLSNTHFYFTLFRKIFLFTHYVWQPSSTVIPPKQLFLISLVQTVIPPCSNSYSPPYDNSLQTVIPLCTTTLFKQLFPSVRQLSSNSYSPPYDNPSSNIYSSFVR